jgi:hypothetical protein
MRLELLPLLEIQRDLLREERGAGRFAGVASGEVDAADESVVRGHLESREYPTLMACLYGDEAGEALGYPAVGVSAGGGLRFANSASFLGTEDAVAVLGR